MAVVGCRYKSEVSQQKILFRGSFGTQRPGGAKKNAFDIFVKNAANTSIVHWGGRLLALFEAAQPVAMDPYTLETLGVDLLGGNVKAGASFNLGKAANKMSGKVCSGPISLQSSLFDVMAMHHSFWLCIVSTSLSFPLFAVFMSHHFNAVNKSSGCFYQISLAHGLIVLMSWSWPHLTELICPNLSQFLLFMVLFPILARPSTSSQVRVLFSADANLYVGFLFYRTNFDASVQHQLSANPS